MLKRGVTTLSAMLRISKREIAMLKIGILEPTVNIVTSDIAI